MSLFYIISSPDSITNKITNSLADRKGTRIPSTFPHNDYLRMPEEVSPLKEDS
jgi:hypothetical protein